MSRKILLTSLIAALAFTLSAADEKKDEAKKSASGPLQPQMNPDFDKTDGTLGEKPEKPWTDTTIKAGVDGKPLQGKAVTLTGEIIDLSCYLQLGKHGEKHKACGSKCITAGQPIGLLTKEGGVYLLIDEEHDPRRDGQTSLRKAAGDHFAQVMEVTGTETSVRGIHTVYVQGFVNK
jgi:hypothetical protein